MDTKTIQFPCKECLVKSVCKDACDKIITDDIILEEIIREDVKCPDCGSLIEHRLSDIYDGALVYKYVCDHCKVCYKYYPNSDFKSCKTTQHKRKAFFRIK